MVNSTMNDGAGRGGEGGGGGGGGDGRTGASADFLRWIVKGEGTQQVVLLLMAKLARCIGFESHLPRRHRKHGRTISIGRV